MRSIKKIVLFLLLISICIPALPQDEYCGDIFNRLRNTVGLAYVKSKPVLKIEKFYSEPASTFPNGQISIDIKLINYCRRFGSDSINALAYVLAHEMAHHFKGHSCVNKAISSIGNDDYKKKHLLMDSLQFIDNEAEADRLGIFYSMNAGYDSWRIAPAVLDSIYLWYDKPAQMEKYPILNERKAICKNAISDIKEIMPFYKMASYFLVLGKNAKDLARKEFLTRAELCLQALLEGELRTQNILNNMGVLYFLEAQPNLPEPLGRLIYPLIIDEVPASIDMDALISTKGQTSGIAEIDSATRETLIKSKQSFIGALSINPRYLPARLNLGLVHFVLGEKEELSNVLKSIKDKGRIKDAFMAIYYQLEGGNYYLNKDYSKMQKSFKTAYNLRDSAALLNMEILINKKRSTQEENNFPISSPDPGEKIFSLMIIDFFAEYYTNGLMPSLVESKGAFTIFIDAKEMGTIFTFRPSNCIGDCDCNFYEITNTEFKTSKGLHLGSTTAELESLYENYDAKEFGYACTQYLFRKQSLIVTVDPISQTVIGISYFYYGSKR